MKTQYFKLTTETVERPITSCRPGRFLVIKISGPINAEVPPLHTERSIPAEDLHHMHPSERRDFLRSQAARALRDNLEIQDHDRPIRPASEQLRHASAELTEANFQHYRSGQQTINPYMPQSLRRELLRQLEPLPEAPIPPEGGPGAV